MSAPFKYYPLIAGIIFFTGLSACKKEEPIQPPTNQTQLFKLSQFSPSLACAVCHPQQYDEWRGSRHRFAGNDPIWRLANNGLQISMGGKLGSTCWPCHVPLGFITGNTMPMIEFSALNPMVREGVNCEVCHTMRAPHTTTNGAIRYNFQPGNIKFGPMTDPISTDGNHEHGYDESFARSDMCRECHDLIVNNIPVEITNTELERSPWNEISLQCQDCHMSVYTGSAAIGAPIRNNLHRHDFVAVSPTLGEFPNKQYQRAAGDSLLKLSASMNVKAPASTKLTDSVTISVMVYNDKTGHNVPTSVFFFRQMWIEVTAFKGRDTVYRSGHLDANGDLMDIHSSLAPNADKDLALFSGILYKNGVETDIVEMDSMVNNSIPAFESRNIFYRFQVISPGIWNINVRLLFRPYGPYLLRSLGADQYLSELRIVEMINKEITIDVR